MHLYKHFWKMVCNYKAGIIIYLSIGMIMMLIVGITAPNIVNEQTEDKIVTPSVQISYVDYDKSVLSEGIIEYLLVGNELTDYSGKGEEEINNLVYFDITDFFIEIPAGFEDSVDTDDEDLSVLYRTSAAGSSEVFSVKSGVEAYINMYRHYVSDGASPNEATTKALDLLTRETDITVRRVASGLGGTVKEWSIYEMSVYFIYLSLGMVLLSAGAVIVNSGDENIGKRVEASPVGNLSRLVADTTGLYTFGLVIWVIVCSVMFIYGRGTQLMVQRGHLLAILILLSIMANCSLTAFITSFNMGQDSLSKIANIVGLSMSFMSGIFVPQWLMGEGVLTVARFLPFYWAVRACNTIYTECGAGITFNVNDVYRCFGMLGVYIVAFALLAVLVRKMRKA